MKRNAFATRSRVNGQTDNTEHREIFLTAACIHLFFHLDTRSTGWHAGFYAATKRLITKVEKFLAEKSLIALRETSNIVSYN